MPGHTKPERREKDRIVEGEGGHERQGTFNPQQGPSYTPQERTEEGLEEAQEETRRRRQPQKES